MPTFWEKADLERILESIDAPIAIAIIMHIDSDGWAQPEVAAKGVQDDKHMFLLMHQLAKAAGVLAYNSLTPAERAQMALVLPINNPELIDMAKRLGIWNDRRNGRRN